MLKYYGYALAEKMLTYVPKGKSLYDAAGYLMQRNSKGTSNLDTSFQMARKAKALFPNGGSVMDVGSGWFHRDAFILHLVGDYEVTLFDIEDKANMRYIRNYLQYLLANTETIAEELSVDPVDVANRLAHLLTLSSREEIYEACRFRPCMTASPTTPFLEPDSVDLIVSNCVLVHIPRDVLLAELQMFRGILKPDGYMFHRMGNTDHWSYRDARANSFNFYRYSDRDYARFFESFEYHNRLVKQEWMEIFEDSRLSVAEFTGRITDESVNQVKALPHIDERFAKYPIEDLALTSSCFLVTR
jgi:SAM-dependent methyltransferase